ncbi:MAG: DUF4180 domain-containing protein [Bacteroidales bacterium]|nr:DUF4180 domain-containing protein [Bacteroidales bacterium]
MKFEIHTKNGTVITELISRDICIENLEDALNLIANAGYLGSDIIIINADQLHPDFFVLQSGLAGEILQKFSTYRVKLAITGNFENVESTSLRNFISESNRRGQVIFIRSVEEAINRLGLYQGPSA